MNIFEIIGWIGSALFIVSYFLLSINKLKADNIPYQLMNILGGLCLVVSAYSTKDRPNLFTNVVWMFIGLFAVIQILKKKERKKNN
ncbi:CBU_0592 family membrane protein [Polaribacter haliotis]|uniref:CBU_0592 family membrane protein n=1 Tax=Polaribacter haliotis TaxID=1888915 RepID=UPI000B4B7B37